MPGASSPLFVPSFRLSFPTVSSFCGTLILRIQCAFCLFNVHPADSNENLPTCFPPRLVSLVPLQL